MLEEPKEIYECRPQYNGTDDDDDELGYKHWLRGRCGADGDVGDQ
jgi:hypothetical protein